MKSLYSFATDYPTAPVVLAPNGLFYGTTYYGGINGQGSVFKVTPSGAATTLYSFCATSSCPDGQYPVGGLFLARNGALYGTTSQGGASGFGTVFRITPSGALTTLHSFTNTDGADPQAAPIQASNGLFYGTAFGGGSHSYGTIYKMTASGSLTVLHNFCSGACTDGQNPTAPLVQGSDGKLYGTNLYGYGYFGTVFRITLAGKLTTLHTFTGTGSDGANPWAGLVQGTDGNFYGTTYYGGINGAGSLFQITPSGVLTTLYSFAGPDGTILSGGLVQNTNGMFYGTTNQGGAYGVGTVFSLSIGMGPFVGPLPGAAKTGAVVRILGTNLTGATSVTFNGTVAAFTVVGGTLINATVPVGATSGAIQVVTPGGTLSSNVNFTVLP
jgi:uncharacterized repeat protein (TIGR03803 family)